MSGKLRRAQIVFAAAALLVPGAAPAQNPATANESPAVHVIGTTPIPGLGTPVEEVPSQVQSLSALSINTKSGFSFPGQSARLASGAFGRTGLEFESGDHGKNADGFIAGNSLDERGWREHSSSAIRQLFAKAGWQDDRTDIDLSLA